ncbi:MAG: flagellin [Acidobacteriota bacterium]|nr:flagellin [Acidobacteriota bacterium]
MSLSILNNIAALYAQNNLNTTQSSLQNTLQQLSSGSRINSGADDAAGLAVADGLHANQAALAQSTQNASSGIGLLQTADGSLSQVTNLLDRAVTLATEASNGTLTDAQVSSANQEYQNILSQIGNIGSTSNFNSSAVFTSKATNIVVTDGTSGGLNTYADTIGVLTTGSVGTSAGTAVVATTVTPTVVQAAAGVTKVAGQYTITPGAKLDTLSGQISFTVGSGTEVDIQVAAGTTIGTLKTQLMADTTFTGLGLSAAVNQAGTGLLITGPTSGADVAANSVTFTGTSLTDSVATPAITGAAVAGAAGSASQGTLTMAGGVTGDSSFGGSFTLHQTGNTDLVVTITAASDMASMKSQIAAQVNAAGTGFTSGVPTGTADNPVFNFTGASNTTAVTITANSLVDATTVAATFTGGAGTAGTAAKAATYTLSALSTATDTFGVGSTITVGSTSVSLDGMDGTAAAAAIAADSTISGLGITAAFDAGTKKLTITGNSDGTALVVTGAAGLKDVSSATPATIDGTTVTITKAAAGSTAIAAGTTKIALLNSADTLSGTLNVVVGSGSSAKTAALTIKSGTTGVDLATQITQNASFLAAGIKAAYDANSSTVTLTGPNGAANSLTVTGTVTDSTTSTPGVGANFTAGTVSQLTAVNAKTILTTVTSAIADVAYQRGTLGAYINQLTSASNVASAENVNLTSAEQSIRATNYGQAASDLSKYQILSQTGISALAQANSVQQEVLKLLQ